MLASIPPRQETAEAWPGLGLYERFEQAVALALTFLVSCAIVVAIADLVLMNLSSTVSRLKQAIFYIERNPETVKSITSFPCIRKSF